MTTANSSQPGAGGKQLAGGKLSNPPKHITDPTFRYVNAASTDIRKTFARVRKEMKNGSHS